MATQKMANDILQQPVSTDLLQNLKRLGELFTLAPDFIVRNIKNSVTGENSVLVFIDGLTDKNSLNNNVIRSLENNAQPQPESGVDHQISISGMGSAKTMQQVEFALLEGKSVLFRQGMAEALVFDTQGWPQRAIEDPQLEASLKGSHQGFVETGNQNIALIRRYIASRELKIKELVVGKRAKSKVWLLYLADVVKPDVLLELQKRIEEIDADTILNSGELEGFIEDNPYSPFPQFLSTERPDAAASQILQGRIAIVVDRSPAVIIGPASFSSFFQSVDDYSTRWLVASFIRLMRFFATLVALFLPALYISVISFNYEIIPLRLLLSIGESRERVPLPPLFEAMMMEISLEMMREAGIRLPAPIGQTVGIVGGIIIGQAAVQAGIVSNIMVIVVAMTAIASFIIPSYDMGSAIRFLRFGMMIIASMFGMIGIVIGAMTLIGHLIALESLGTPYGSPFAPVRYGDWKDTFVRLPIWKMKDRPHSARPDQIKRMGFNRPKGDGK